MGTTNWYKRVVIPRLLDKGMKSEELKNIRQEVLAEAKGITLEIGSGPGYNFPLYKNITKLYALEPSKELIEISKARTHSMSFPFEFLNTEAESIPLADHSVDTVVSTWTLCSVTNPEKVLSEITRVLLPGGNFVFVEHGASPNTLRYLMQRIFTSLTKHFTGNCHYDRNIEVLLESAGLRVQKISHPVKRFMPLIYNYQGIAVRP